MVGIREYSSNDRSLTTFILVGIVLISSIILAISSSGSQEYSLVEISTSDLVPTQYLALFRLISSVVCLLTIAVIALDPKGLTYNVLDYETKRYGPQRITGTRRLSAFTMWSFTLMGLYFGVSSMSSWSEYFGWEIGHNMTWIVPALLSSSIASALLVSGTVTFLLIPEANARGDNIEHYFKWDSQLMHNGNVLLIFAEAVVCGYSLTFEHVSYPIIFGCIYVLFSAFNARRSGIYFYDFIDPRLNGSHIIHMVLLGVVSCMFFLVLFLQNVREMSQISYMIAIVVICYLVTTFSNPSQKGDQLS